MSAEPVARLSALEYLEIERASELKSEFLDGEMFAMTGASFAHNRIGANLLRLLGNALRSGPCQVATSDQRVKIAATGLYTYPDAVVVCGRPEFEEGRTPDTLLNPAMLVEVLSPSTEATDRGKKFEHYRAIPSLREVMFISQDQPLVEHFRRLTDDRWLLTPVAGLEASVELPTFEVRLPLAEIFERVLPPAEV